MRARGRLHAIFHAISVQSEVTPFRLSAAILSVQMPPRKREQYKGAAIAQVTFEDSTSHLTMKMCRRGFV